MTHATTRIHRRSHRFGVGVMFVLALVFFTRPAMAAPDDTASDTRGIANIAIRSDLTSRNPADIVMIHLVGNQDQRLLTSLAATLGEKFKARPVGAEIVTGDPLFVPENDIGLTCYLPIMHRNDPRMPIAPFIEAFAPYASELRIVYIVQGDFTYQGPWTFENADVSLQVDKPETAPNSAVPFAFYGMHVKIKNPSLTSVPIADQAETSASVFPRLPTWMVIIFAGAFGAAIGLIVWQFLPRGNAKPRARRRRTTPTRETRTDAGTRNDQRQ